MPRPTAGYQLLTGHFREGRDYGVIREQGTADWLLLCTVAGAGRIGLAGEAAHRLGPDEVCILRPGVRHDYRTDPATGHWELLWAHVIPPDGWLDLLDWPELSPGILHLRLAEPATAGRVREALRTMSEDGRGQSPLAVRLALNALERALLACQAALPAQGNRLDPRIRACLDLLTRTLDAPPAVAEVAAQVGMSPSRLAHLFRAEMGLGIAQWRDQRRIQVACDLLATTGHTIAAVAQAVGFTTQSRFGTRFRQLTGASPSEWRTSARRKRPVTPYDG